MADVIEPSWDDETEAEPVSYAAALLHEFGADALPQLAVLSERHGSGQGLVERARNMAMADRLEVALRLTDTLAEHPCAWASFGPPHDSEMRLQPRSMGLTP